MRRLVLAIPLLALAAASGAVQPRGDTLDERAAQAIAEARTAEAEARRLEKVADEARNEAQKLRAQQLAAAQAIEAAEARISAADANARLIAARLTIRRDRLRREQAPASALLGALAVMAERPPLLAVLDSGSTQEFVRVRLLLDATLPAIRVRTAALRAELERGRTLQQQAAEAKLELVTSRDTLAERKSAFAELEAKALKSAALRGGEALVAGDIALARGEQATQLVSQAQQRRQAAGLAEELASLPAPPSRPGTSDAAPGAPFPYVLPALPVVEGLGAVAPNGVRSRGLTLQAVRGAPVPVPASGTVRFAGPFRSYDSVIIIDHGDGWMSLVLNVATSHRQGDKVVAGQSLGRALGRIGVELSRNGRHVSPALIAGSSQSLSKRSEEG